MAARRTKKKSTEKVADNLTIARCLEIILQGTRDEYPNEEGDTVTGTDPSLDDAYDFVCSRLEISKTQAEILGAIIECSGSGVATSEKVSNYLGYTNLHFLSLQDEIDSLIEKRFLRLQRTPSGRGWSVPNSAIRSIQKNEKPSGMDITNLSGQNFIRKINILFRDFFRDRIDRRMLEIEVSDLIRYNPQLNFVKQWTAYGVDDMDTSEQLLLLFAVIRCVIFDESAWGMEDFGKLYAEEDDEVIFCIGLESGDLELFEKGLIEHSNSNGIVDPNHIVLTSASMKNLLPDLVCKKPAQASPNLLRHNGIAKKEMFYNDAEQKQINTITKLLEEDSYQKTIARLKEKKMRGCINILFAGGPGTGKTETVYQISRLSGRDIYLVNVSELKSKWVGDSEKNVKALFDEYRKLAKESKKTPILLFNEADAIFGVRKRGAVDSVDKMNNTIQNILLQELESLEGICIATTNITDNLDSAFERRFLFKVQFEKPGKEAMKNIWCSMIEELDEKDAETLSNEYEFSGGQIENVSRQMVISYVISGDKPTIGKIKEFCDNETVLAKSQKPRPRIGY